MNQTRAGFVLSNPAEYPVMRESVQKGESPPSSQQLRSCLEITEGIVSKREAPALFKTLAGLLHRIVRFDHLWLNLYEGAGDQPRLEVLEPLRPSEAPLPVQDIAARVWQNQRPVVTSIPAQAEQWPDYYRWAPRINLCSLWVLPLTAAGRRLSALGFGCRQPGAYDSRDVDFLRLVANQVAVALDNALNYEDALTSQQRLARERDRLGLLLEVTESIASHRDLGEMFRDLGQR